MSVSLPNQAQLPHRGRRWRTIATLTLLCLLGLAFSRASQAPQPTASGPARNATEHAQDPAAAPAESKPAASAAAAGVQPKDFYGLWTIAPPLVAILVAVLTRQVIVALSLGVLTAAGMVCVMHGVYNPLRFVTYAMDHYLLGVLASMKGDGSGVDAEHVTIIIYTMFIGAMIGVLRVNGGTRAVVARVTRRVHTRRAGQLSAVIAGLLVFFDDYASAMIVGPGLRPIFDRLKISREKLAYLVNWTSAPDSSIFLGTWLAVQISYIDSGFKMLGDQVPAFLANTNAANTFWATIPYRTYTLLTLVMVVLVALTGRDFLSMRKAERQSSQTREQAAGGPQTETLAQPSGDAVQPASHWLLGAAPAILLVLMTVLLMATTGWSRVQSEGVALAFDSRHAVWESLATVLGKADSHYALLYASLSAAVLAIVMTVASRRLTLAKTMDGAVSGMTAMFAACIILVLAWGLSTAGKNLQLGPVAQEFLTRQINLGRFSLDWLPLSVFLTACLISFATGTTWGTMAILCPPVVTIAAGLLAKLPPDQALMMFYYSVGAAMAGAVFGNTCSPLADVTVLSSIFTGCELYAHVRTTLPYAVTVGIVSVLCTDVLRIGLCHWWPGWFPQHWAAGYGLAAGAIVLLLLLLVAGRKPTPRDFPGVEIVQVDNHA